MKKNDNLILAIMLKTKAEAKDGDWFVPSIEGVDNQTLAYHIRLTGEMHLLHIKDTSTKCGNSYVITGITEGGYDYLAAAV